GVINPMKMFEYLAAGRAILSADLPSIREVLNENYAVLCDPENATAWRAALESLLLDEKRRLGLGRQARRLAARFSWSAREQRILNQLELSDLPPGSQN
ncbi:MAG TPA: glycosyltransferase, partial [Anaerolineales bacterium]